jgi:RHS repeat-associated protein
LIIEGYPEYESHHVGITVYALMDAKRHRTVTRSDRWGRRVQVDEFAGTCSNAWSAYACAAPFTTAWSIVGSTSYRYTPLDLLDQVTDALGNLTSMSYDSRGRKLTMRDPDMGYWRYAYDVAGKLTQQTDAKHQTTTFEYDALARLVAKHSPDGRSSFYAYDQAIAGAAYGKGQRTSMRVWVNGAQQSYADWQYDARGRATSERFSVAGLSGSRSVTRSYDSADRLTALTYPSGETVRYTYDQAWRQTSVCSSLGGCYASNAQYTALDQPLSLTFGNGLPQTWQYTTPMQRLAQTDVGTSGLFARRYTYDPVGNVASLVDPTAKADTQTFTYDHRDRLTSVTGPTTADTDTYTYDAIGNLLQKGGQTYTYGATGTGTGAGPHQVRSKGGWSYTYDANGNLVSHNGRSYTWNSDNLPARLTIPNVADEHYTYDADGERLTRTVNGVTTVYLAGVWEEEIPTGVTRSHYALQEQVVAQRSSNPNVVLYLHRDHLGSVSAATDASGLLVSKQDFTPWGEIRGGGSGMTETSLNYTGQHRDSNGLLFYHARYYDPNLGRFLSADTVVPGAPDGSMDGVALTPLTVDFHEPGFLTGIAEETTQGFWFQRSSQERQQTSAPWGPANAQALNRYSYVQNNPLKYTDPTGHTIYLTHDQAAGAADLLQLLANDMNIMSQLADVWMAGGTPAAVELLTRLAPNIAKMLGGSLLNIWVSAVVTIYVGVGIAISNQLQALADTIRALNGKQGVALQYDWWGATSQRMAVMNRENGTTVWVGFPIYVGPFIPEEFWIMHNAGPARKIGDKPENGNCLIQGGRPVCSGWKTYL